MIVFHGVAYVVVGGVAAVLQAAPVTMFDIDTLVKVDPANAEALLQARMHEDHIDEGERVSLNRVARLMAGARPAGLAAAAQAPLRR